MPIDTEIIDKLLKDYKSPEDVLGENGLLKEFTKAILERATAAELRTDFAILFEDRMPVTW